MKTLPLLILVAFVSFIPGCDQIQKIYDILKTGAPCLDATTCLEGTCMTPAEGFPNGMCTRLSCEETGCWSFFTDCFPAQIDGEASSMCLPTCSLTQRCERASEGYECRILDESFVCVPNTSSVNTEVPGITGATCHIDSECHGENAVCLSDFKNGYCSQIGCSHDDDCFNQQKCLKSNPSDASAPNICLKSCKKKSDCRFGYDCIAHQGEKVCLPGARLAPKYPNGDNDGESCRANMNCKGGVCIRENGGEPSNQGETVGAVPYIGGYCTTRDCNSNLDCNGSSVCVERGRSRACFKTCNSQGDCRDGYDCVETPSGKVCDSSVPLPVVAPDGAEASQIVCQTSNQMRFNVPNGAIGFYISPFTKDGGQITPTKLAMPSGKTLNIETQYSYMAVNPFLLGSITPILFPATDTPPLSTAFGEGDYTLTVKSKSRELCYYMIPKMTQGSRMEVRIHLVGVPGVTAQSAGQDKNIQEMLRTVSKIYQKMGVSVSVRQYVDASQTITNKYRILRNFRDVFTLVATTENIGTLEENLVVNVFLIQDFAISEAPGLLGVSTGIPGVAGLSGNIGSGLVFSTSALGTDNIQLGQTMAHEIGHFLALRHTTERGGNEHDPISDSPRCSNPDLKYSCPDARNFMFAYAMGPDQNVATNGQGYVVRHSPLVK